MNSDATDGPAGFGHDADDASTLPSPRDKSAHHEIGPYRLLECIGKGGMGEVWLADQKVPIKRRVAVKLIKQGMDTKEVIARFESERQALAMMNHPNVARIIDAGSTDTGHPYFVMEYVPGQPITDYCDRHKLDLRTRLELFIPVCQAIHHAHQKGIIHRDIKPSNVLVAVEDGRPVPKVIDFGVAKATQQSLTEKTIYTAQGKLVGTPAYMSPEQAEMTGLNVDTTSDVYSLGALLYELLVGAPPFDAKRLLEAGIAEIHRIIREVEPPKPSTKISSFGDQATKIAALRRMELRTWQKQIHGELDWITVCALEKDRSRRYQSALELSAEIERYLRNEPVMAGPPSASYRARKFMRRNKAKVIPLAILSCLLVVATVASVISSMRARIAENDAVAARRIAEERAENSAELARQLVRNGSEVIDRDGYVALAISKGRFSRDRSLTPMPELVKPAVGEGFVAAVWDSIPMARPTIAVIEGSGDLEKWFAASLVSALLQEYRLVDRNKTRLYDHNGGSVIPADFFVVPLIEYSDGRADVLVTIAESGRLQPAIVLESRGVAVSPNQLPAFVESSVAAVSGALNECIYTCAGKVVGIDDPDVQLQFTGRGNPGEVVYIIDGRNGNDGMIKARGVITGHAGRIYTAVLYEVQAEDVVQPDDLVYLAPQIFVK